jgi:predicted RND superfamily exporter protein
MPRRLRRLRPTPRGSRPGIPRFARPWRDNVLLTRHTTLWLAWVGFNLSHSLGAILFGVVVVLIGRSAASFEAQASVFLPLTVLVSATYLVLGARYWFRTPIIGISLAAVCFLVSWLLFAKAG